MQSGEAVGDASVFYIVSRTGKIVFPETSSQTQDLGNENGEDKKVCAEGQDKGLLPIRKRQPKNPDCQPVAWKRIRQSVFCKIRGDEDGPVNDSKFVLSRKHHRQPQRNTESCKQLLNSRSIPETSFGNKAGYQRDVPLQSTSKGCHAVSHAERRCRLEQHVKKGLAQLSVLHRWEEGTREAAVKWASWLLKLLRKARPRPCALQRLLFTVCASVLPLVYYSLVRQTWLQSRDSELLKSVDILWRALQKSRSCFSRLEWDRLGERINECHRLRMKVGNWVERYWQPNSPSKINAACKSSRYHAEAKFSLPDLDITAEITSNELVISEGVQSLVRRAVREKLLTPCRYQTDSLNDIQAMVSLVCPLSGSRIKVPARGKRCLHRNCFDLQTYLEVHSKMARINLEKMCSQRDNHHQTTWRCPICGVDASWSQLVVDGLILRMLEALPESALQAHMLSDGICQDVDTLGDECKMVQKETGKLGEAQQDPQFCLGLVTEGFYSIGLPIEQIEDICRVAQDITSGSSSDSYDSSRVCADGGSVNALRAEKSGCHEIGLASVMVRDTCRVAPDVTCGKISDPWDSIPTNYGAKEGMENVNVEISGRNLGLLKKIVIPNLASRSEQENPFVDAVTPSEAPDIMGKELSPSHISLKPSFQDQGRALDSLDEGTKIELPNSIKVGDLNPALNSANILVSCLGDLASPNQRPKARQKRKARKV